jgi:hypothetical protein
VYTRVDTAPAIAVLGERAFRPVKSIAAVEQRLPMAWRRGFLRSFTPAEQPGCGFIISSEGTSAENYFSLQIRQASSVARQTL